MRPQMSGGDMGFGTLLAAPDRSVGVAAMSNLLQAACAGTGAAWSAAAPAIGEEPEPSLRTLRSSVRIAGRYLSAEGDIVDIQSGRETVYALVEGEQCKLHPIDGLTLVGETPSRDGRMVLMTRDGVPKVLVGDDVFVKETRR